MKVIFTDDIKPQITSSPSLLCTGSPITFDLTGVNLFPQVIEWNFGDPASGAANNTLGNLGTPVNHTYAAAGQYVVHAIYTAECKRDTVFDTLTVITCNNSLETCLSFQYTGAPQQWTVPPGVDTLRVKMWGAAGGGGPDATNNAGGGGYTEATIAVTPGQVLNISVGGGGAAVQNTGGIGAWPNGGAGGTGNRFEVTLGDVGGAGGGGGRSQINIGNVIFLIAGGGGGGSLNRAGGGGGGLTAEYTAANNSFNLNGFGGSHNSSPSPLSKERIPLA